MGKEGGKEYVQGLGGQINLNRGNGRLEVTQGTTTVLFAGLDNSGNVKVKLAKPGFDALTATADQLILNSDQNSFKIASILTPSYFFTSTDASNAYAVLTFPHSLSYKPTVLGSFVNTADGVSRPLQWFQAGGANSKYGVTNFYGSDVLVTKIDTVNITVEIHIYNIFGLSFWLANQTVNFRFYCLQETIV